MSSTVIGGGDRVDARALESALKARLQGEVRFDDGSRALYATDASNYRQVPIGVVLPKTKQDILQTVALCHQFGAPLLSRGAGTSLAGQCCNVAVVMDMSKYYNQILEVNKEGRWARIQPGVVLDVLRAKASTQGLTFGPDPATHAHCTLGGMMGNNSCGVHALMAGKTVDNVLSLEILTYDGLQLEVGATSDAEYEQIVRQGGRRGEIYAALRALRDRYADLIRARYPKIPRRVSGYNLDSLLPESGFQVAQSLIGSECTLITILEATVRLVENPRARSLVLLGYPSIYESADHVPDVLPFKPIGLEGVDDRLVAKRKLKKDHSKPDLMPPGRGWLYVEFGGATQADADAQADAMMAKLRTMPQPPSMKRYDNAAEAHEVWEIRESALGATAFIQGERDTWEGWEDSAVEPAKLGTYLRDLRALYERYGYEGAFYGHFGQGCIHTRITFDLVSEEGLRKTRAFLDEAADLVIRHGGSLSGEHGDGQARAELYPKMFGPELVRAFEEFKAIWDPRNKMNPGKVVHAYKILDNLRLGADYHPHRPATTFSFPKDDHDFSRAALRCVGVGKCRRDDDTGVMCPSYRVTREEMHSTRGRAHLLFEMLRGEVLKDGWKSEEVKEALDLCLSCKGCKSDCPVTVDIATYKAEFLSHYYEGRLRPRSALAFGRIATWSRLAAIAPRLVNFFTQTPGFSALAKWAAGMAPARQIPPFAPEPFTTWFRKRPTRTGQRSPVLLWPDTFNNYFHPHTAQAAVEVLEHFGYEVRLPRVPVCCGRPLYDYGYLDRAKAQLEATLEALKAEIEARIPVVGLEPSCLSVFRDELTNLLDKNPLAQRLASQTFTLGEFLMKEPRTWPRLDAEALVQGHCHQRSVLSIREDQEIFKQLGLRITEPESSCCGMAGAFGFEAEHYDVAMQCGEQALLPAARNASPDTLFIANGFSCREQIHQATSRLPLHLADVLLKAIRRS